MRPPSRRQKVVQAEDGTDDRAKATRTAGSFVFIRSLTDGRARGLRLRSFRGCSGSFQISMPQLAKHLEGSLRVLLGDLDQDRADHRIDARDPAEKVLDLLTRLEVGDLLVEEQGFRKREGRGIVPFED